MVGFSPNMTSALRRGERERQRTQGEDAPVIMEAETRAMHLEAKECQRLLATPTRKHGPASTLDPSEETQPH